MIRKFVLVAAGAIIGGAQPVGAHAFDSPQMEVRYGDLDLTSAAGIRTLNARVAVAVRQVCAIDGARDLQALQAVEACRQAARASVEPKIAALIASKVRKV